METAQPKTKITISTTIKRHLNEVWHHFTHPESIQQWNHASDNWHCPAAKIELADGGHFCYTMAAKDGSMQFYHEGLFTEVTPRKRLKYETTDGRKVSVYFQETNKHTTVVESFETDSLNPPEVQQQGWQAILDSFKRFMEETTAS
ncbi:SRPBCC domain-containing protein [Mangrovibacterium marinum]|uniref:Uncharacterized protein YndB with AHSA1/START domain n=1 Tax=Mangrovibacterium marinum TaxID=1639118 RepID=A0A2T5C4J6_9BACT|nr:SRPBCC domain-containing protein [Mangrovibacterium marinum]PTN09788.1 uncharacterized protein YndB with AHSA1/START domain [Mangrovibacterium marinum]